MKALCSRICRCFQENVHILGISDRSNECCFAGLVVPFLQEWVVGTVMENQ
jgi:hypothetical protein